MRKEIIKDNTVVNKVKKAEYNLNNWVTGNTLLILDYFQKDAKPRISDHLYVKRSHFKVGIAKIPFAHSHHGIYVSYNEVIEYDGDVVRKVSLEEFARGNVIHIKNSEKIFTNYEIVRRAHSRLGEKTYSVVDNNCEHFCKWCRANEFDKV